MLGGEVYTWSSLQKCCAISKQAGSLILIFLFLFYIKYKKCSIDGHLCFTFHSNINGHLCFTFHFLKISDTFP